jgi:hypothetical protein
MQTKIVKRVFFLNIPFIKDACKHKIQNKNHNWEYETMSSKKKQNIVYIHRII